MHEDARLRQRGGDQAFHNAVPGLVLRTAQGQAEMPLQIPVREQRQFAAQQDVVVLRQHLGPRRALPADQRIDGRAHQGIGILLVEHIKQGPRAEIAQQQEPVLQILRQHRRYIETGGVEQAGDAHERFAVLMLRRRVHDDP